MCGIAGFLDQTTTRPADRLAQQARAMAGAIAHRGPDDEGVWTDPVAGVALAHRRLAIIDLSQEGHQPMASPSGRFTMVFNGEIYNYKDLRQRLERAGQAPAWRGHSDTEVILAACEAWGVNEAIDASHGMFAVAIWDAADRVLVLARDRIGEKPLYYGWQGTEFLFGSELKALEAHSGFKREMDSSALESYLRFGYVPAPLSIYKGIRKLQPGEILRVSASGGQRREAPERYWCLPLPSVTDRIRPDDAVDRLHNMLVDAVKERMHADVPLGVFLSGGIDSSTIAALMMAHADRRVRTFSIGFEDKRHNEALHAAAVAKALGTDHEELYVTAKDAIDVVPSLPQIYDEPFADSSQIPTYLLSKLTRRRVTVALSGDGGDELFGGYTRYLQARTLLRFYGAVPQLARGTMASGLNLVRGPVWDAFTAMGPRSLAVWLSSDRLGKLADVVGSADYRQMYGRLVSHWHDPRSIAPQIHGSTSVLDDNLLAQKISGAVPWMMHMDQLTYLPDDILVKVDRASMAVGLEARVPFLDHRVIEFAATLPLSLKIRGGTGKWVLRQVLFRYLDRKLVDRPKQGFAIPVAAWLRGALRDWAEDLLSVSSLSDGGILTPAPIREVWRDHLAGRGNHQYRLWNVLMLQSWLRRAGPTGYA